MVEVTREELAAMTDQELLAYEREHHGDPYMSLLKAKGMSNRQYLWIEIFYAASSVAVVSSGRSTSLPFSNFAPARTSATRWGALTARQRDWAASISL